MLCTLHDHSLLNIFNALLVLAQGKPPLSNQRRTCCWKCTSCTSWRSTGWRRRSSPRSWSDRRCTGCTSYGSLRRGCKWPTAQWC